VTATRPNGLPALRNLSIKFKRRTAAADSNAFDKLVGKSTDRAKHSPYEYVSEDGRWIIRSVHHSGHGSTNSGRVRWHVARDRQYFPVGWGGSSSSAMSLEDAIDEIHRKIARGVCEGFKILAEMRKSAEKRERDAAVRATNIVKARDLLDRLRSADFVYMYESLASHVDLDVLDRAIQAAEVRSC
jgi:hypothetical protein